jgi:ribosomal protein S18 acetylase RimI-like enzyme
VKVNIKYDCIGVDWKIISETLKNVGMAYDKPEIHRKAFENSHTTIFIYHGDRLVGFGRAISDGLYQAAVYDVAVVPEFQKKGIGTTIIQNILDRVSQCNVILYSALGKEEFYKKLGLRKMKTGMALFRNAEEMKEKGFTE